MDLFCQDYVHGGEGLDTVFDLIELGLDQLHFRTDYLEGMVDVKSFFNSFHPRYRFLSRNYSPYLTTIF
jgi:hypothetical protein